MLKLNVFILLLFFTSSCFSFTFEDTALVNGFAKGYALTSDQDGLETAQKNPAGITTLSNSKFQTSYTSYFDDAYQTLNFSYGKKINSNYVIGFQIPTRLINDILETQADESGEGIQVSSFSDSTYQAIFSLGKVVNSSLTVGANIKGYYRKLYNQTGNYYGLDLGAQYKTSYGVIGASFQDINSKMNWDSGQSESIPMQSNLGMSITCIPSFIVLADYSSSSERTELNSGLSWFAHNMITIHAGLKSILEDPRFSLGLSLQSIGFSFDYAYSKHEYLGTIHKVGVSVNVN